MDENTTTLAFMLGRTLSKIEVSDDEIVFHGKTGHSWRMYHEQDCCENVYIEDIDGNISSLIGSPIIRAEEVSNRGATDYGTETWTFYKFATVLGSITIRWYGSSNGYYSESVSIREIE